MLLVVTIIALLVGWQVKVVNDRRVAIREIIASGGSFPAFVASGNVEEFQDGMQAFELSAVRRLLGDHEVRGILFPRQPTPADRQWARLFPEADVWVFGADNSESEPIPQQH